MTGMFSFEVFFKIFDTMILPVLTYGAEIWGFDEYQCLERIQFLACRSFLGVSCNAPNVSVLGECGRVPIFFHTARRCVKYWCKLLNMPDHRYPKKCYNMLYNISMSGVRFKPT